MAKCFLFVFLEIWQIFFTNSVNIAKEFSFLKIIFPNLAKLQNWDSRSRVPILDTLKINLRRFWRDCCLRPPFHPQKQGNRAQSGSPKSSENAFVSQIVIFASAREQEAKRWRANNGDEDHNSHKDDDDDLASCLPSAAVAPAPHAFDVSLLLMLRHLLPSGTLFSFLFFFFPFLRIVVFPGFCFTRVLFKQLDRD